MATKPKTTVTVTFRDSKFEAPIPNKWPGAAQYELEQGNVMTAIRGIIGKDQFSVLLGLDPTLDECGKFLEQVASLSGADLGKSEPPSPSNEDTQTP